MSDPATSVSQELPGVIDTGEESFSVDFVTETVEDKSRVSTPAEEKDTSKPDPKDGEEPSEPEVEPEEELPSGVKKKLSKLTRKRRDAERATEAEVKKREGVETELETLRKEVETLKEASTPKEPVLDDFDTEDEFIEAKVKWKVGIERSAAKLEREEKKKEQKEKDLQDLETDRGKKIQTALKKGSDKYDDFDEVISGVDIPTSTLSVFESLDNPADVAYYLGENPDTADSLNKMDAARAGAELQRISTKLKPNKSTKAPDPITPLSSTGGNLKSLENMGMAEYNKARDKQDKERIIR